MVKKKLKRWGNNLVLVFTQEDEEVYGLIEGGVLDLDNMLIEKIKKDKPRKKKKK